MPQVKCFKVTICFLSLSLSLSLTHTHKHTHTYPQGLYKCHHWFLHPSFNKDAICEAKGSVHRNNVMHRRVYNDIKHARAIWCRHPFPSCPHWETADETAASLAGQNAEWRKKKRLQSTPTYTAPSSSPPSSASPFHIPYCTHREGITWNMSSHSLAQVTPLGPE